MYDFLPECARKRDRPMILMLNPKDWRLADWRASRSHKVVGRTVVYAIVTLPKKVGEETTGFTSAPPIRKAFALITTDTKML